MKKIIEKYFPAFAAWYRWRRDLRSFSRQVMRPTRLGFDFIGVEGMPEAREASGEVSALRDLLRGKDLFVDVGANCGLYSLLASQTATPVIAVEPNLLNFQRLLENIRHNGFHHAEALNVALGSERGRCLLYGGGEGASLVKNWGGMASTYAREVDVLTLDSLIEARTAAESILIKIDVEGHELDVLAGAKQLLARVRAPTWILEHSFRENQQGGINTRFFALFDLFWSAGYSCYTFDAMRRQVSRADVERWLSSGVRDYGGINYIFTKDAIGVS